MRRIISPHRVKLPIRARKRPRFPFLRGARPACFCGFGGGFSGILLFLPGLVGREYFRRDKPAGMELVSAEDRFLGPDSGNGAGGPGKAGGGVWGDPGGTTGSSSKFFSTCFSLRVWGAHVPGSGENGYPGLMRAPFPLFRIPATGLFLGFLTGVFPDLVPSLPVSQTGGFTKEKTGRYGAGFR